MASGIVVLKNNPNKCVYCGACVGVCPTQALVLKDTKIVIFEDKCISCGACVTICPVGAMSIEKSAGKEKESKGKSAKNK